MKPRLVASALLSSALLACRREPAPPPTAPVTVDVPPMPPASASELPPPSPAPLRPPAPSLEAAATGDAPTTVLTPLPSQPGTQPFDRARAAVALASANVSRCAVPGGPTGHGHITVVWEPNGSVSSATLDQGPLRGTTVGACVERVFSTLTVPPYAGSSVRVGKSFHLK